MKIQLLKIFSPKKALKLETSLLTIKEDVIPQEIKELRQVIKKENHSAQFYSWLAEDTKLNIRNVYKASTSLTKVLTTKIQISDLQCQRENISHMIKVNKTKLEKLETK